MTKLKFQASADGLKVMYRTPWGRLREQLLSEQLAQAHRGYFRGRRGLSALDLGCGLGQYSIGLAKRGWRVTLLDPDPQMLQAAAAALRVAPKGSYRLSPRGVEELGALRGGEYDLVMIHVLLEYIEEPRQVLRQAARLLRPGGALSLLYNQPLPAALFRLMRGDLAGAERLVKSGRIERGKMGPCRTYRRSVINGMLRRNGLTVIWEKGVRAYCDYLPNRVKMTADGYRQLLRLERRAVDDSELLPVARMVHVLAGKGRQRKGTAKRD